jgi:hypothetical protein
VVKLRAGFLRAGTYNVNTVAVFVTYSDDQSQMILQNQPTPSIITLLPAALSPTSPSQQQQHQQVSL